MGNRASVLGFSMVIAACSTFTTADPDPALDGGPQPVVDGGGPVIKDASGDDAAIPAFDAGGDGGAKGCTSFAAQPYDDGWMPVLANGGTLVTATFLGRSGLEARVTANGQRALVARTLNVPLDGQFAITVPLHVVGGSNGNLAWVVEIVSISCTNPVSSVTLELAPDGTLVLEASPPASGSMPAVLGVPPSVWSDLRFAVSDTVVTATLAGKMGTVTLDSAAPFRSAVGCAMTIGAAAKNNVAATTVRAEKVCLEHL